MTSQQLYEDQTENQEGIPVPSRRSTYEDNLREYLKLREEIETRYKEIRVRKRKIEKLIDESESLVAIDKKMRGITATKEEEIQKKKKRRIATIEESAESSESAQRKKIKNAIARKKKEHAKFLKEGFKMTEEEIRSEGGEVGVQYVYFKESGNGKSQRHVMKGIHGLKLSSLEGEEHSMEIVHEGS